MHSPAQLDLDLFEFHPHAVAPAFALQLVAAAPGFPADEGETQEGKGFRLALPAPLTVGRRLPRDGSKLQQSGFAAMQFKSEFRESLAHGLPEALCIGLQLETGFDVVGLGTEGATA
jgi:hypothetical protein